MGVLGDDVGAPPHVVARAPGGPRRLALIPVPRWPARPLSSMAATASSAGPSGDWVAPRRRFPGHPADV